MMFIYIAHVCMRADNIFRPEKILAIKILKQSLTYPKFDVYQDDLGPKYITILAQTWPPGYKT